MIDEAYSSVLPFVGLPAGTYQWKFWLVKSFVDEVRSGGIDEFIDGGTGLYMQQLVTAARDLGCHDLCELLAAVCSVSGEEREERMGVLEAWVLSADDVIDAALHESVGFVMEEQRQESLESVMLEEPALLKRESELVQSKLVWFSPKQLLSGTGRVFTRIAIDFEGVFRERVYAVSESPTECLSIALRTVLGDVKIMRREGWEFFSPHDKNIISLRW